MSFYDEYLRYKDFDIDEFNKRITDIDVERLLGKRNLNELDFLTLLSPRAESFLEDMAHISHSLTVQHFGKTILMYTPMYLANYCTNECIYCGFNKTNKLKRNQLSLEEVELEAKLISSKGIKHILILTGDARDISSVKYIRDCVLILKKYFHSISIEIYALEQDEYKSLIDAGVDSITIYQETYNEELYDTLHLSGPKKDYRFRLDAPERASKANIRNVNVGALLGLDDFQREAFLTGLHAKYIEEKFPNVDVSISMPRIRPSVGGFEPKIVVSDKNLVQFILASRLYINRAGITISTREDAEFRNNVISLGVTKMSADSNTSVGGHTHDDSETDDTAQFDISDTRDLFEMCEDIKSLGYQPVLKDWDILD